MPTIKEYRTRAAAAASEAVEIGAEIREKTENTETLDFATGK